MKEPADKIADLAAKHKGKPGALLPLLHAIQDEMGYIPPESARVIASALNLSSAEVQGVITFYHSFRTEPSSSPRVEICCAESCQSMGSEKLLAHARSVCEVHPVYCLGLCASSPAMMVDEKPYARVTPEKFDSIVKKAAS